MNTPSTLGMGTAAILCALAMFLAYDAEVNVAPLGEWSAGTSALVAESTVPAIPESSIKEDWDELLGMNMRADLYRKDGLHEEAELEEEQAHQKIRDVARNYLGADLVSADNIFFFHGRDEARDLSDQCDQTANVPAHMADIRGSKWFGMFAEKYSQYGIKVAIQDKLPAAGTSYGLFAESEDGMRALTYFQDDPCTGQVTAVNEHVLVCISDAYGYNFLSSNRADLEVSLTLEEFCFIAITDPWRQAVYDYADELMDDLRQLDYSVAAGNPESIDDLREEAQRLSTLAAASARIASDSFRYDDIRKIIQDYCDEFGPLPEDYTTLVEQGAQDVRLDAC